MNHFFLGEVFLPKHLCRILCVTSFIEVEYDKLLYLKPTLAHFRFYPFRSLFTEIFLRKKKLSYGVGKRENEEGEEDDNHYTFERKEERIEEQKI